MFDELDSFAAARGTYTGSRRRALDGQPAAHRDGRLPQGRARVRRRHHELRRVARPGAAASRPLRVRAPHPVSERRRPPRDPEGPRQEARARDDRARARLRGQAHRRARARSERRHALLRRSPAGAVSPARAHAVARKPRGPDRTIGDRSRDRAVPRPAEADQERGARRRDARGRSRGHRARLQARAADRSDLDPRRYRRRARLRPARATARIATS